MICDMKLSELQSVMPAHLHGNDVSFSAVSTDSRTIAHGDLFVALQGDNFDGNKFASKAVSLGACGLVVSEKQPDLTLPQLQVADTCKALGWLGYINRKRSQATVVALTGSQGKTSVKEMTQRILSEEFDTHYTKGNLNNTVGAPLTLLQIEKHHERAVIELGANSAGEIAWTAMLADPDIVLINNASETHLEGFGSLLGVVEAKGEIIDAGESTRLVVLNADDPSVETWKTRAGQRNVVLFSIDEAKAGAVDYLGREIKCSGAQSRFVLQGPSGMEVPCSLPLPGRHNVANAVAAAALAISAGASSASVQAALSKMSAVTGRLNYLPGLQGSTLIDDSYNASPNSFRAAIDVLVDSAGDNDLTSVLIMGDMAEMGDEESKAHYSVGDYARKSGVNHLWATGKLSRLATESFGSEGRWFESREALIEFAQHHLDATSIALVKGSRSAAMDTVVAALKQKGAC